MKLRYSGCALAVMFLASCAVADDKAPGKLIFDGESLQGWKGEEGYWRVENGAIVGESTSEKPLDHNTFLVWEQGEVDDFELTLKFRISGPPVANGGVQFRSAQRPDGRVAGYQADIDREGKWIGGLHDELGRGPLVKRGFSGVLSSTAPPELTPLPEGESLLEHIHLDDWNEYSITAIGERITIKVNGHVTADAVDNDVRKMDRSGILALQLHSGPPTKVEFKDIRLKRLPLTDGWKKMVFIAGRPSHPFFSHEHNAGCLLLADKINAAQGEHGLKAIAAVYLNGWPKDPTAFDNVDTVVSYCDGGQGHYLNQRLEEFDALVEERNVGLVCIHYAVETVPGEPGDHFLKWIGGFFEPHWSVNPHWTAKFEKLPVHPITRGVDPFEINDEWYYHMRFQPDLAGVTPILSDLPPRETLNRKDGPHSGNPMVRDAVLERKETQHVAWAYERPNGKGRGFGFTGGHFHKNWQHDDFRKLVLNAIVWTAGMDVPAGGVPSTTPNQSEMESNVDSAPPADFKFEPTIKKPKPITAEQVMLQVPKPAYSSPRITPATPGRAVDLDVDITGAKKLILIATNGGDGIAFDWADWIQPRITDGQTETPLTDLKWVTTMTGWGDVRVNENADGKPLQIDGQTYENGISAHATSLIEYQLPEGHSYTRFLAKAGLDDGGVTQAGGEAASVQFHVFTVDPGFWLAFFGNTDRSATNASHESVVAVEQLDVHPELQATLFASEPMLTNPMSIDIDHLGRVWVCESINYRSFRNEDVIGPDHPADRVLILEDSDGDGQADDVRVFYQGHDVDSAHGILVLPTADGRGTRAIMSAGESVFALIDDDGDLQADRKEVLFTGIQGVQHDHGVHAVHFGPDGKLYFNFGNSGGRILDKDRRPIIDRAGNVVDASRKPYQEGMVFRCNLDGSEFETLAWNFRNNWEACVDAFGSVWQSDNDDDGNRAIRINYIMEYGNFGFKDEMTGAGWNTPRTNRELELPLRHWHLNDPGVVPNLLQTGAGAPTGICVYEGDLLPKIFHGALLHCDAGPNIFRAYPVTGDGAGYKAEMVNILDGARNSWFRPSDVCVAPDGSVIVADWYDPGVGGHRMQDIAHGRLFRITPNSLNSESATSLAGATAPDVSAPTGAARLLSSPNMATRYLAWTALKEMGESAEPALLDQAKSDNPRARARAYWMLGKLGLPRYLTAEILQEALDDADPEVRIVGIRLMRQLYDRLQFSDVQGIVDVDDPSPVVRRELAIALRDIPTDWIPDSLRNNAVPVAWAKLASHHDGQDRWYLEALGIGAHGRWNACLDAYLMDAGEGWKTSKASRDIVWRSRADRTAELLGELIQSPETPKEELPRLFRALDFQPQNRRAAVAAALAFDDLPLKADRQALVRAEAINRVQGFDLNSRPDYQRKLEEMLTQAKGTPRYLDLVEKFDLKGRDADVLKLAVASPESQIAADAIRLLNKNKDSAEIKNSLEDPDRAAVENLLSALKTAADPRNAQLLQQIVDNEARPLWMRRGAISALAASLPGARQLLKRQQEQPYSQALLPTVAAALSGASWPEIRDPAQKLFPAPPGKDSQPLPSIPELEKLRGDVAAGRVVFNTNGTCNKCHQVNGIGLEVGPNLSEIGKKLSRAALYESILYPSAGISHNYETWLVLTLDGQIYSGLMVSETDDEMVLKDEKGLLRTIAKDEIEERKKQDVSLMPADLQRLLTQQELVDVVEYLTTLKERKL